MYYKLLLLGMIPKGQSDSNLACYGKNNPVKMLAEVLSTERQHYYVILDELDILLLKELEIRE